MRLGKVAFKVVPLELHATLPNSRARGAVARTRAINNKADRQMDRKGNMIKLTRKEWREQNARLTKTPHGRCRACLEPYKHIGTAVVGFGLKFLCCPKCTPEELEQETRDQIKRDVEDEKLAEYEREREDHDQGDDSTERY